MSSGPVSAVTAQIIAESIQRKGDHADVEEAGVILPVTVTDARSRTVLFVIDESSTAPDRVWEEEL